MTTTNPLDRIEVGKQYRYVPRPTEMPPCPECGHVSGSSGEAENEVGTVVSQASGYKCCKCEADFPCEGYWNVAGLTEDERAVPYTFLQPLAASAP